MTTEKPITDEQWKAAREACARADAISAAARAAAAEASDEEEDDETICCENCDGEATTEHDGVDLCDACHADRTFECPTCDQTCWVDDRTDGGLCCDCQADDDADLEGEIADLIGDGKGHLIRAALKAAGLIG